MFDREAKKIGEILDSMDIHDLNPILEIGSSTEYFRKKMKPHINENIHEKINKRGIQIICSDIKPDPDVIDQKNMIIGSVFDDKTLQKMIDLKPRCILLCNILEHVTDSQEVCNRIQKIATAGTLIVCSVPYSFPYHPDPIDTLYRPSPEELIEKFSNIEVMHKEVIEGANFGAQLKELKLHKALWVIFKQTIKIIIHTISLRFSLVKASRLFWFNKNYSVSLIVLKQN